MIEEILNLRFILTGIGRQDVSIQECVDTSYSISILQIKKYLIAQRIVFARHDHSRAPQSNLEGFATFVEGSSFQYRLWLTLS